MKKIYLLPFALLAFTNCKKDFLNQENPNAVSIKNYFKSENDVLLAINGAYQALRSGNTLGETAALYNEERSDNTGRDDNQSAAGEPFQFNDFSLLPSNTYLKTHWVAMYEGINRCNIILSNIDDVNFSVVENKERYKSEVKFIRALIYFHLVRKWGDIPLSTTMLVSKDDVDKLAFRQKEEIIYTQIVQDLKEALASNLPNTQWEYQVGRVSKTAINALLGQVYLTMGAGLSLNKAENFKQAETFLTTAYQMRTFGKLSEIPYADVFDVSKKMTNKELILQIQYIQGDQNYKSSIAANNQAKGEKFISKKESTGVGGNVKGNLVKDYETKDLRKDFSIKFASDPQVNDYYITKFRDTSATAGVNGWGGNDWILMRHADVMLLLAEAKMNLGKDVEAIILLNEVRERAGLPSYADSRKDATYSANYPTLKDAILHERRVELAFENQRWFDLVRNYSAEELVKYFHSKKQEDYGNAKIRNISTKDRFFPIPYDEYKLNPEKMYQNPGY